MSDNSQDLFLDTTAMDTMSVNTGGTVGDDNIKKRTEFSGAEGPLGDSWTKDANLALLSDECD